MRSRLFSISAPRFWDRCPQCAPSFSLFVSILASVEPLSMECLSFSRLLAHVLQCRPFFPLLNDNSTLETATLATQARKNCSLLFLLSLPTILRSVSPPPHRASLELNKNTILSTTRIPTPSFFDALDDSSNAAERGATPSPQTLLVVVLTPRGIKCGSCCPGASRVPDSVCRDKGG
ncbi:hypothetical protein BJV74DRAFT_475849 [Russula compacta]|nr:hypothetical protein BJV74DRAFT_475849 [Russula compacta]